MKKRLALIVLVLMVLPALADADSHVETATQKEVRDAILKSNAETRETLKSPQDVAKEGCLQFWSSGGLLNSVAADDPPSEWESYKIVPKHITVVPLVEGQAAVAMYYSEGSMQPKGSAPVPHYLTRVTEVYVKQDGQWKLRAAHWSPVVGGSGTSQVVE